MKHVYLIAIFIFIFFDSESQTADFTYTSTSGILCSPQVIKFTQTASGNPVSFVWNFGNGKTGNRPVESVIYTNAGTYTVKLIAVYNNVAVAVSKTIIINPGPQITVTANRTNLCTPGPVNFTAGGSPFITNYRWDFGDGTPVQTTSANNITHEFTGYDTFNIIVQGITASGCNTSAGTTVKIAHFKLTGTATPAKGCIPVDAILKMTPYFLPGDALQNVTWNFGDGTPSVTGNTNSIHHGYNTTNTINTANVVVTSTQGCTSQFVFDTLAFGTPPTNTQAYTVSQRDSFCASEQVAFFAQADNAELYKWKFGDGSSETTPLNNVTHKFRSLGNKNVVVTPILHGCEGQKDTIVLYIKGVIAKYDITNTCNSKNSYYFPDHSLGNVSHFEWTFGDAPAIIDSVNRNASHTFPTVGSFYSNLVLTDNITGCLDTLKTKLYTAIPAFSSNKNAVCKDSLVVYQVSNDYPPNTGYSYEFHINNVVVDNGHRDTLSYYPATHGNFNDYVVIKDRYPGTCNDSIYLSQPLTVKGPVADFNIRTSLCLDSTVMIINNSYPYLPNEPITTWRWEFGDSEIDSTRDPIPHQYPQSRTYKIKMTATDINHCAQTLIKPVVINPLPRVDILPRGDTICLHTSTTLIAYSSDPVLWTSGNGISCNSCDTITVTPAMSSNYIATATSEFGCKNYDSTLIKVNLPSQSTISPANASICEHEQVQLNVSTAGTVTWNPPMYLDDIHSNHPVATPATDMHYTAIINDPAGCFNDTLTANIIVHQKPVINAGSDRRLDYNEPFTISPAYPENIVNYLWTPAAALDCNNCAVVNGTASKKQTYNIKVTDAYGCTAEDDITIGINCANSSLLVPEAFSPNADGVNDYFYPIARGYEMVTSFTIYNRTGVKVFERKNFLPNVSSLGWNGMIKGNQGPDTQTFIWIAVVECDEGQQVVKKGTVLLIR